jgi:hypothetical protein
MTRLRYRPLLALLVVGLLAGGLSMPARAQFGVAGGLNFESADDIETASTSATLDNSTGYHVGLVYDLSLGPVSLRPGVFYRRVGTYDLSTVSNQLSDPRYTVTAWEVPVDVRVTILPTPLVSPYLLAGPKAVLPRGEDDFDDAVEDVSYTLNVGVGAEISLPVVSLTLQPELRYEFGATGFIKDDTTVELGDQNVQFSPQDSPTLSTFALRLNVLF